VGEQLEEVGSINEGTAGLEPRLPAEPAAVRDTAPRGIHWLRLVYALEFLLALLVVLTLWSEIGGQSHLDMMTWYTKLLCILGASWCMVRFTAAIVESPRVWNRRSAVWFLGLVFVAFTMGAITYYYHLHEETDQDDSSDTQTTALIGLAMPGDALEAPKVFRINRAG